MTPELEFQVRLRDVFVTVVVDRMYILDGELDQDDFPEPDELVLVYRVLSDKGEILCITPVERAEIYSAAIKALQEICS